MFLESEELGTNGEDRPQYDFLQQLPGQCIIVLYIIVTCQFNPPCFHDLWPGAMAEAEQEGRGVTQVPTQNTLNAYFSKTLSNVDPKCISFTWTAPIPKEITFLAFEYDICIQFWKQAGPFWGSLMSISSAWFQGQRRLHRLAEPVQEQIAWHNNLIALHDMVCSSSPQWYLTINIRFVLFYEENCSEG